MFLSPELPTQQEQKAIDRMVDADIDFAVEQAHVHEVVKKDWETHGDDCQCSQCWDPPADA